MSGSVKGVGLVTLTCLHISLKVVMMVAVLQVHSEWLKHLEVFSGIDLPLELFAGISTNLDSLLFGPDELLLG